MYCLVNECFKLSIVGSVDEQPQVMYQLFDRYLIRGYPGCGFRLMVIARRRFGLRVCFNGPELNRCLDGRNTILVEGMEHFVGKHGNLKYPYTSYVESLEVEEGFSQPLGKVVVQACDPDTGQMLVEEMIWIRNWSWISRFLT